MVFQQHEHEQISGVVVVGRLYNRMPQNMIFLKRSSDSNSSNGSTDTLVNNVTTNRSKDNISLHCPPPPPLLRPSSSLKQQQRSEQRERTRCGEGYNFLDIVKDAEESPKLSKRSKAKAKKVRLLFHQEQQQRHDKQLHELQEQAVAAIKKAAIREEILYYENRNQSRKTQTRHDVLDRMELESYSSGSEYTVEYNDIIENENDNHDNNHCFLTQLVPFFQFLKDKFDDQLLKSMP